MKKINKIIIIVSTIILVVSILAIAMTFSIDKYIDKYNYQHILFEYNHSYYGDIRIPNDTKLYFNDDIRCFGCKELDGMYDPDTKEIFIDINATYQYDTIRHELKHHFYNTKMSDEGKAYNKRLYKKVCENEDEFFAYWGMRKYEKEIIINFTAGCSSRMLSR